MYKLFFGWGGGGFEFGEREFLQNFPLKGEKIYFFGENGKFF